CIIYVAGAWRSLVADVLLLRGSLLVCVFFTRTTVLERIGTRSLHIPNKTDNCDNYKYLIYFLLKLFTESGIC
ncbi:MAG: hypothetical protein ACTS4T_01690, partial [Candidatus Hodgkinia cicadicola]